MSQDRESIEAEREAVGRVAQARAVKEASVVRAVKMGRTMNELCRSLRVDRTTVEKIAAKHGLTVTLGHGNFGDDL